MQLLRERLPPSDHLAAFLPAFVSPALVGVRHLRMLVKKTTDPPADGGRHERQEEKSYREEEDLRHHRNEKADEPEDKEEDRERQIPQLVAADAGRARGVGGPFRCREV